MNFNFNISPQKLNNYSFYLPKRENVQRQSEAELFGVGKITQNNYGDSFTRTTQTNPQKTQEGFQDIYKQYYTPQKINAATNSNIKKICDKNNLNSSVTQKQVANIDKSHLEKTCEYSMMIADRMGLSQNEKNDLKTGAVLHDIGKAYMPEEILNKPGALSDDERTVINAHSELGAEIAKGMGANNNVVDIIKNHHSDTKGGKLCNILKVADRYSALTQKRSYKDAFTPSKAYDILDREVQNGKLNGEILKTLKGATNQN